MRALKDLAVAATLVLSGACASPPPKVAEAPLEVPAVPNVPVAVVPEARSLPSAPAGTSLIVRVRSFTAVAREVVALMGVPPSFDATMLLHSFVDPDVLAAVDLAQPMDGLNSDNPNRAAAAAFTMRADGESVLREHFELRVEGAFTKLVKKDRDRVGRGMPECALHAGRIVCAYDDDVLATSAPYLATTLAAEPVDHAVRFIIPGEAIRNRPADKNRATEDRLATELVAGLEREIERIEVDLDLGATITAATTLHLVSRDAPLTRALVPSGPVGPAPASFSRLPADASLAIWSNGAAAEDLAPLKKAIAEELQSTLESDGYAPAAAKASIDELASLFLTGGPFVLAAGKTKSRWFVAGVDEPAARWTNGLRALVKKSDEAERSRKKPSSPPATKKQDGDDVAARIAAVPASAKLPPDSLHVELKFTPKKKGTGTIRIAHLWVVPDGKTTWIGYGEDDAAVRERIRAARDGAANKAAFDGPPALAGGHSTTNGLVTMLAPDKGLLTGGGEDRITVSVKTEAKALSVRLEGPRQAALDFAKTFL